MGGKSCNAVSVLDEDGQHEFHSCVGALGWVCNVRTDIMIKVSELQSKLGKAGSDDLWRSGDLKTREEEN